MGQISLLPDSNRRTDRAQPLGSERVMLNGTVKRYFEDIKRGTIRGDDQKIYTFSRADWMSTDDPKPGIRADFELGDNNQALKIRPAELSQKLQA